MTRRFGRHLEPASRIGVGGLNKVINSGDYMNKLYDAITMRHAFFCSGPVLLRPALSGSWHDPRPKPTGERLYRGDSLDE